MQSRRRSIERQPRDVERCDGLGTLGWRQGARRAGRVRIGWRGGALLGAAQHRLCGLRLVHAIHRVGSLLRPDEVVVEHLDPVSCGLGGCGCEEHVGGWRIVFDLALIHGGSGELDEGLPFPLVAFRRLRNASCPINGRERRVDRRIHPERAALDAMPSITSGGGGGGGGVSGPKGRSKEGVGKAEMAK